MATLVDELVTRYTLDAKDYNAGAAAVVHATKAATDGIEHLGASVFGGLKSALTGVLGPIAALAGGAGLMAAGTAAVKAAISFDTIQRSLQAVTGSAERAKEVLKFDDQLAGPSIFTSEDLAQASLTLEAFKLQTERFLPVAEKLGTVFGGNADALKQFVDALGYIKNGRFGEGFESLTRAGLSRSDFESKGLSFDKGGSYTGDADQALKAIEELVNERFGKLSEAMADGPGAKLASVMDAIGRAARVAGNAILTVLMPAAEKIGGFIAYLVDSGAIEKAVSGLTRLFDGGTIGDGVIHMLALMVSTLQQMPAIFLIVREAAKNFFAYIRDNIETIGGLLVAAFSFGTILEGINLLVVGITKLRQATSLAAIAAEIFQAAMSGGSALAKTLLAAAAAAAAGYAAMKGLDALAKNQQTDMGPLQGLQDIWDRIEKGASVIEKGFGASGQSGPTGAANSILSAVQAVVMQQLSVTNQIAANTAKTAKNTDLMKDLQRSILGGGEVGQMGITPVEAAGIKRGGHGKWDRVTDAIREAAMEEFGVFHSARMTSRARMAGS